RRGHRARRRRGRGAARGARGEEPLHRRLAAHLPGAAEAAGAARAAGVPGAGGRHVDGDVVLRDPAVSEQAPRSQGPPMDGDPAPRRQLGPASDRRLYVPADRILHDWKEARGRALAYLGALGLEAQEHAPLAARAVERALTEPWERGGDAVSETLRVLRRLFGRGRRKPAPAAPADQALYGSLLHRMRRRLPWTRVAFRRRLLLGLLVLVPTIIASEFMVGVLPHQGRTWLEVTIAAFFGALFGWISIGFWTALLGFVTLVRRRDRFAITSLEPAAGEPPPV